MFADEFTITSCCIDARTPLWEDAACSGLGGGLKALSDEDLMAAHAQGEAGAFDELFNRYAARLAAVLGRGLRRQEDARDLLQQVFLQLHRHRADYQVDLPFRPWLYTIAMNVKRQHLRTLRRRPEAQLDDQSSKQLDGGPAQQLRFDTRQQLDHALRELPEAPREVVLLHWFGGLSMAEIGTALGISEAAVKVRAHRAYVAMRGDLEAELGTISASPATNSSNQSSDPGISKKKP